MLNCEQLVEERGTKTQAPTVLQMPGAHHGAVIEQSHPTLTVGGCLYTTWRKKSMTDLKAGYATAAVNRRGSDTEAEHGRHASRGTDDR